MPDSKPLLLNYLNCQWRSVLIALVLATPMFSVGCDGANDEPEVTRYEPDDGSASISEQAAAADATEVSYAAPTVMEDGRPATAEEQISFLMARAQAMEMRSDSVPLGQRLQDMKGLVKIGDEMQKFELNERQKVIAFQIKITALLKLHATADRKAREQLIKLIDDNFDSSDEDIVKFCHAGRMTLELGNYLRTENGKFPPLKEEVQIATKKFPNSLQVANESLAVIVQLLSRGKREQAIELMKMMQTNFKSATDPEVKSISATLSDKIYLADIQIDRLITNVQRNVDGAENDYFAAGEKMAKLKTMGPTILSEIVNISRWLEQTGKLPRAERMLKAASSSLKDSGNDELIELVNKELKRLRVRTTLVGKRVPISGETINGISFDNDRIKDKTVMLYFWSAYKPQSVQTMQSFLTFYTLYKDRGMEIVSYCVDKDKAKSDTIFGANPPPWINLYMDNQNDEHMSFVENTGVQFLPYVVLINQDGTVTDINVPFGQIQSKVDALLAVEEAVEGSPDNGADAGEQK